VPIEGFVMRVAVLSLFAFLVLGLAVAQPNRTLYPAASMPPMSVAYELAKEPDYAAAKLTTMRLQTNSEICSATAIGHHHILTAKHCVEDVTGQPFPALFDTRTGIVTSIEFDDHDAAILTVDLYFGQIAHFGPKPKQGDVVFSHANPNGTPDMLLIGRVAGWIHSYMGVHDVMLMDRNDWYGSSGAGVLDTQGRIVGVVNAIYPWPNRGWRLMAVFPITFTADQLKAARQ
jgi:hypothetical protein